MRKLCEEMKIMADETRFWGGLFALALLSFLAGPSLGEEAAVGEVGGGYMSLGDGSTTNTLSVSAPANIGNFPLIPGQNNVNSGAESATITTEGAWTLSVSDANVTTAGKMTEYWTNNGTYVSSDPAKLEAAMLVKATGTYGSGNNVTLPTGGQIAGGTSALTDEQIPITFTQPVYWTDQVSKTGRGYKIVVTFTVSSGS